MPADAARRYWGLPALAQGQGFHYHVLVSAAVPEQRRHVWRAARLPFKPERVSRWYRDANGDLAAFFVLSVRKKGRSSFRATRLSSSFSSGFHPWMDGPPSKGVWGFVGSVFLVLSESAMSLCSVDGALILRLVIAIAVL